ncbi:GAF domain-containing protein [Tropicimonas sp. IMCC6043]|uniref:GAF domain-containing protein n=1 Tax=Tropicimonas sp. IMCC6043 TaxID=2510645 RepID=UPI00101DADD9|nr:GAF domain-containing protein [Tropicimonas sp. IMCC6043]RYH07151.1 GAF domain-containing protein [Tropicimonas sp. IMCC6043]
MTDHQQAREAFESALAVARTEAAAFDALCALAKATVGAKLFTVMTVDMKAMLARRAYTDDAGNYPTSGTKPIEINPWFEIVHGRHETFVANTLADIDKVFPDADLIGRLGCGSVVNLPILLGGGVVATVNILHEEGYYSPERVALVHETLRLPAMAAMAVALTMSPLPESRPSEV